MRLFGILVSIVLMSAVMHSPGESLETVESVFVPPTENCTKNLLELLLWQHGMHVARLVEEEHTSGSTLKLIYITLLEMKELMNAKENRSQTENVVNYTDKNCDYPFVRAGSNCVMLTSQKMSWDDARHYCASEGSDLAIFEDVNTYAEILAMIRRYEGELPDIWVGGSDVDREGSWRWVNGKIIPSGPPMWGSSDHFRAEPSGGRRENCAILYKNDKYYMHDIICSHQAAPLCGKN
ncbi:perlucin-like protein [Scylla paramamosain]